MASTKQHVFQSDTLHVARALSEGVATIRDEDLFTDFQVIVQGKSFRCHRLILASVSDYFKSKFSPGKREPSQNDTILEEICPKTFQIILDILYQMIPAGDDPLKNITDTAIEELLHASVVLQMPILVDISMIHFSTTMTQNNCIERLMVGNRFGLKALINMARDCVISNFENVVKEKNLNKCSFEDMFNIIQDENLAVQKETTVWRVISDWIMFDEESRQSHVTELLRHCYLTEIGSRYLMENIVFSSAVRKNSEASALVQDAICYLNLANDQDIIDIRYRKFVMEEEVVVLAGVCENTSGSAQGCFKVINSRTGTLVQSIRHNGPLMYFACCAHGNTLYISGGNDYHGRKLYGFHAVSMSWKKFEGDLPVPLMRHVMVAKDESLFAISGITNATMSSSVFQYSLNSHAWVKHGDVATSVKHASAVCWNEKIYVIGGQSENLLQTQVIQVYDINNKSVTLIHNIPRPCTYSQSLIRADKMYTVSSKGDVYIFELPVVNLKLQMTIPKLEDRFGISVSDNQLTYFSSNATVEGSVSNYTDWEEENEKNDVFLFDIPTSQMTTTKLPGFPMAVYGCASILRTPTKRRRYILKNASSLAAAAAFGGQRRGQISSPPFDGRQLLPPQPPPLNVAAYF